MNERDWKQILSLLEELIEKQQELLLKSGEAILPHVTKEDLLQPNDFLELENNPLFRFEEGVLVGFQTVQMSLLSLKKEERLEFEMMEP